RDLEEFLLSIGDAFEEAVLHHMAEIKRLKFRNGFFSRGIYLNKNDRGRGEWFGHTIADKTTAHMFQEYYCQSDITCQTSARLLASS
ncbi:MAG: hypothetical protein HRU15_10490, partial [Planctomycetes bacterium]|nr:hypothetical protein [Planctomycetota bacterium]